MVKAAIVVLAVLATGAPAWAQDAPSTGVVQARRQQMQVMEGVLATAVKNGAKTVAQRMQIAEPSSLIVTDVARARGFALDGYGVFFDVDVPAMRQSVAWSTRMLIRAQQQRDLQRLQQMLARTTDPDEREELQVQVTQLKRFLTASGSGAGATSQVARTASSGTVEAQSVADTGSIDLSDPNELYTEAVKTALIDAILDYSGPMNLGADEWFTVAARDSEGPLIPGALEDKSTLVVRVRGRDLTAFQAHQITRDEAYKRVEVKEF